MLYFLLWCALSTTDVILQTRILHEFPFPLTLTMLKLGIATLCYVSLWIARVRSVPRLSANDKTECSSSCPPLLGTVVFHTCGLALVNQSLRGHSRDDTAGNNNILVFDTLATRAAQSSTTLLISICKRTAAPTLAILIIVTGIVQALVSSSKQHAAEESIMDAVPTTADLTEDNNSSMSSNDNHQYASVVILYAMTSNLCFSLRGVYSNRIKWLGGGGSTSTPANNFGVVTSLSFLLALTVVLLLEGSKVKTNYFNHASVDAMESLLMEVCLCGLAYFLSIEMAYYAMMFDPNMSALGRTQKDVLRQAFTMAAATFYFEEKVTRNMAVGYGIALAGQLLQAYGRTVPKELSRKNPSPRKVSPPKIRKRS